MEQKRKILPPVYLLLTVVAMTGFHYFLPLGRFIVEPYSYFGFVLIVVGLSTTIPAAVSFKKVGTPVVPFEVSTKLVTTGLYRFTRNPMYLGMVVFLIGIGLLFGSLGSLIPVPLFVWIIRTNFIRGEENFLAEIFGNEYLEYKRRARRWL